MRFGPYCIAVGDEKHLKCFDCRYYGHLKCNLDDKKNIYDSKNCKTFTHWSIKYCQVMKKYNKNRLGGKEE